jgi:amidase
VRVAALRLAGAGATLDFAARPSVSFAECWEVFALACHRIIATSMPEPMQTRIAASARSIAPDDRSHRALQARALALAPDEVAALRSRRMRIVEAWREFFARFDILLCPPACVGPIPHDRSTDPFAREILVGGTRRPYFDLMHWAALATAAGLPAAVAPVMCAADGMPRGVQVIGAAGEDRKVVATTAMLEAAGPGFAPPPIIFV